MSTHSDVVTSWCSRNPPMDVASSDSEETIRAAYKFNRLRELNCEDD